MFSRSPLGPFTRKGLFIVAVLLTAVLGACNEPSPTVLRFGLSNMPNNLDPRFATDAASYRISRLIYQPLVKFDAAQRPIPALASWNRVAPTHYRFILGDKYRQFHDGTPLTSRDVKATLDFILDPVNASPHRASIAMIERIDTPDDDTVDFYLKRADPLFPGYLVMGIMPAHLIKADFAFQRQAVGSGPFTLMDWPEDGRLRLRRQSDGQVIEFIHVANPTVRVLKLLRGEIDMVQNDLPPELVTYLASQDYVQVSKTRGSNFAYLGFNLQDPLVGKLPVRQAIAYGIDRQTIVAKVFGNSARPADALLPPTHWAGNPQLDGYTYDPERAKALLKQAGFGTDKPIHLTYKTSSDPFRVRLATILQHQLKQVGVDLDIRSYDWGTFYGDIKAGRFQLYSLAWIGIKTPDIFRYAFHSSAVPPNGANRGRFANPEVDALIEQAETADELDQQAIHYRRLQAVLLQELPYVPLWYEDHVFVSRKDVVGYRIAADGNYDGLIGVSRRN